MNAWLRVGSYRNSDPLDAYLIIVYSVLYILPAYVANGAPILFGGGKLPLDFGMKLHGKRIFGDNKSVTGTASMLVVGVLAGAVESWFLPYMLTVSLLLALGAIAGDLIGSFVKRRIGRAAGASFPVMDQYGFFIVALIFAYPLGHTPGIYGLLFLVVLTGVLHVFTNAAAHKLKLKKVPW